MENKSTTETGEALTKDLTALKQDVTQIAEDLKFHAGAHAKATRERVQEKIKAAREAAAARPFAILGVGFLVGFVFGLRCRR